MLKTKKSKASAPDLLKILWEEGFFSTPQATADVAGELAKKGHYPQGGIAVPLLRSVHPGGFLSRKRVKGRWKYIQKAPFSSTSGKRTELFARYNLHDRIKAVSSRQFNDGYFMESIRSALIEVVDQVKRKAGHPKDTDGHELDGSSLMSNTMGGQDPIIRFNSLQTDADRDDQKGMMFLFMGAASLRNVKAHINLIQKDPEKTIEYLVFASLLLRRLDEAKVRQ